MVAGKEKKISLQQSVRELKGGVLENERESRFSEEVCLPFGHFVLQLVVLTGEVVYSRHFFKAMLQRYSVRISASGHK